MSSLPEGGDMREGGSVSGPFAAAAFPRVIHCRRLLCSTHRTANGPSGESYAVDARFFDQYGNCNYPDMLGKCRVYCVDGKVESMNRLSKLKERVSVSIPSCSRDVSRKWFHGGKMLRSVTFGASLGLNASTIMHSIGRVLSLCPFRTVFVSLVITALLRARVSGVLHLVHHLGSNVSVLVHSISRVSSLCLFLTM